MRTIAMLNLPASTSGIWTLAPPCPEPAWQPVAAADEPGEDPPGAVVHAVATSNPANRVLAILNRPLTMDLLLLDAAPRCARSHRSSWRGWAGLPACPCDVGPAQDRCP